MKFLNAAIFFLVFSYSSNATIVWDESIDGDLLGIGQSIGSLGVGTNTFLGTFGLFRNNGNAASADVDSGFVDLANHLQIISLDAEITSTYGFGVLNYTRVAGLHSPTVPHIYYEEMLSDTVIYNLLPISETGTYRLFTGGGGASVEDDVEFYWDWEINIEVASVTEPSLLALLLTGILSVVFFGIRSSKPNSPLLAVKRSCQ